MVRLRLLLGSMLVVALLGGSLLFGQDTKQSKGRGGLPANWGKLGLSDEQRQKIYSIRSEYRGKIDDLQEKLTQLRKQENAEMLKVLTESQRSHLREILASKAGGEPTGDDKSKDKDKKK